MLALLIIDPMSVINKSTNLLDHLIASTFNSNIFHRRGKMKNPQNIYKVSYFKNYSYPIRLSSHGTLIKDMRVKNSSINQNKGLIYYSTCFSISFSSISLILNLYSYY